ncbi:DUF1893 domain-containing protein [Halanaerobium sp. Z-7514]|uniref:DUF1893 domain-containing protein n=1 Tax=Halanaerobium polyolivorans TaxID=2886943 RepID=A0AAW4X1S8_9FIRM|nr:DUF1893 domain-containing protein [Halanaerobium polyolivorans]MCC3145770.1 DUF1893 domain-containing protein [Halanaerobium polyolivorans]
MLKNIRLAKKEMFEKNYKLVIVQNNRIIYKSKASGIKKILEIYNETPNLLKNAFVADKVIGKAAATIYYTSFIKECFASVMSKDAQEVLKKSDIDFSANKFVNKIKNRNNSGMCPLEKLTLKTKSNKEALANIKEFYNN